MVAAIVGGWRWQEARHQGMKLLVFGKSGQVATELQRVVPAGWSARFLGRDEADLQNPAQCSAAVRKAMPNAVINAAAYTAVDKAEEEKGLAYQINAEAPGAMAEAARDLDIPFLHISTDYVFDGSGTKPFLPEDQTSPLGVYGASKLAGEEAVAEAAGNWLILRTSWVFGGRGANFVGTMLRLGAERENLNVVDDQIGGPTPASAIAAALLKCAKAMVGGQAGGTYHFAGAPFVSWADFARVIMSQAKLDCRIDAIPTSSYPTPAKRPQNSRLDCTSLEKDFGILQPDWRAALPHVISELSE